MQEYYYESDIALSDLKPWEFKVVETLKKAVKGIAEIYSKQRNPTYPGGNFCPHDVSAEEIEKASKDSKGVLNPYTIVKRRNGKLIAVSYYEEYKKELDAISKHLESAAKIYEENNQKAYASYLRSIIKGLKEDNNDESFIKYMQFDGNINVDITLGAFETYQDKLFAVKRAFQANLRVRDRRECDNLKEYVRVVNAIQPVKDIEIDDRFLNKLQVRIDNVIAMGGWHAELLPVGSNYPNDPEIYKYGMKVLVYLNVLHTKYKLFPKLVKDVLASKSLGKVTDDNLINGLVKLTTFHEVSEALANSKYDYYTGKLKGLSDVVKELNSDLTGIKAASIHVLNGIMTPEEYKNMVICLICNVIRRNYVSRNKLSGIKVYADGGVFALGYFIKEGAIKVTDDKKFEVDYQELYTCLANLTNTLNEIMIEGDYAKAKTLFSTYSAKDILPIFNGRVKKYFG